MPLHLIKLCVGCESPDELKAWRAERASQGRPAIVPTRQTPKRAEEILDGGSLYWVIKGKIQCRQPVLAVDTLGEGQDVRCEITLGLPVVRTATPPRRPFQGWRYLKPEEAPPDLGGLEGEAPPELAVKLRELGVW